MRRTEMFEKWVRRGVIAFTLGVLCLGASGSVRADTVARVLHELTPYETRGGTSFEALNSLREMAVTGESRAERELAAFLHATASVDLWLIAALREDGELQARLANLYGASAETLPDALRRKLTPLRETSHRAAVADALAALAWMTGTMPEDLPFDDGHRSEVAFLHAAAARVSQAKDPLAALAALAKDPCAGPGACDEMFAHFDAEGRAAVAALERAASGWRSLDPIRAHDPLLQAVGEHVDASFAVLRELDLQLGPRLARGAVCPNDACDAQGRVGVVAFVEPEQVRLAFMPRVRIDERAQVVRVNERAPVWPETRAVALPMRYPEYLHHIDELVEALRAMRGADASVGVGASPGTPAHVWARVMLSARVARYEEITALGRKPKGDVRVQPARVARGSGERERSVEFKSIGPVVADIFVREVQGVWPQEMLPAPAPQ